MNIADALKLLGLSGTEDGETARRAYLRLLKKHKPDRDPDGFQRVRAAFEAIDGRMPWVAEEDEDEDEHVREDGHGNEDEDEHVRKDGHGHGHEGELAQLRELQEQWGRIERIDELIKYNELAAGAALLEAEVEATTGTEHARTLSLLRACLALMARDHVEQGQALLRELLARVGRTGSELALIGWGSVDLIAMKELAALPPEFGPIQRALLARVVLEPDTADVAATLHFADRPQLKKRLAKLAPALTAMIESDSEPLAAPLAKPSFSGGGAFPWGGGFFAVWLVFQLGRLIFSHHGPDDKQVRAVELLRQTGEQPVVVAAERLCTVAPDDICQLGRRVASYSKVARCERVFQELDSLATTANEMPVQSFAHFARELGELRRAVFAKCSPQAPPSDPPAAPAP